MKIKSILLALAILCLGAGAIPIEPNIATYANSHQSQSTQLKLKGIPLGCYISVGEPQAGETLDELQENLREVIEMLLEDNELIIETQFVGIQQIAVP